MKIEEAINKMDERLRFLCSADRAVWMLVKRYAEIGASVARDSKELRIDFNLDEEAIDVQK